MGDFDVNEVERLKQMILTYHGDKSLLELSNEELYKALGFVREQNGMLYPTITEIWLIGKQSALKNYTPSFFACERIVLQDFREFALNITITSVNIFVIIMSRYLKILLLLFLTVFLLEFAGPVAADTVIVHTNDVHGRFLDSIGYDGLSAYINERTTAGDKVILLDAGDAFQGKIEANVFNGSSSLDIMNALQYDAMAVGNHDFEFTASRLLDLRDKADFPLLAANVFYEDTGKSVFNSSVCIDTEAGKIGIFGMTNPNTKYLTNTKNTENIRFADGDEFFSLARDQVDSLKSQGCDYIVCLSHLGIGDEYKPYSSADLAERVSGIDLIIDGHSHTKLEHGMKVKDTLIVSTGCYLENFGVVSLKNGELTAELISAYDRKDPKITELCRSYVEDAEKKLSGIVVGETKVELNATASPGCRTQETVFGDLIADAILATVEDGGYHPDFALINGGGIRDSIPVGTITGIHIYNSFPFENTVVTEEVSGKNLLRVLEDNTASTPLPEGGFPQVSGMEYTVNTAYPYVSKDINRVHIDSVNGKPFDENAVYRVATTSFIANSGDKYAPIVSDTYQDTGVLLTDAFSQYISHNLNGVVNESYAQPKGRIHIIHDSSMPISASSPVPLAGILAGFATVGMLFLCRRN